MQNLRGLRDYVNYEEVLIKMLKNMLIKKNIKIIIFYFALFFFGFAYGSANASEGTKIYAIGDSLTDSYQAKLANLLGHSCKVVMNSSADSSCEIIYKGLRGNVTAQMLVRFQNEILTKGDAKYIIIWGGINDIGSGSATIETTKSNLQSMYTKAHDAGIKVITINISPFKDSTVWNWSQEKQGSIDAVNSWIANQAVDIDYKIDAYALLEDKNKADTLLLKYDYSDHLHLNSDGQDLIGSAVYSAVDWEISTPTPTGPDCAAKTCLGISCWNGTEQIKGTKITDCALVTATVEPNALTTPGSIFVKWTSTGASKVEAECFSGPIIIPRGGWFTSDAKCKESGLKECTDKGYEFKTDKELTGTETCKFYPTNSVGGQQGTPLVVTFEVKKDSTTPTPAPTVTPTPSPVAASTCHKNNYCPSEVCASKFCDDGCSKDLIRGTRVGC